MARLALPLRSQRLELRAYRPEDVPAVYAVLYGDEQARRLTGGVSTLAETRAVVERYIELQDRLGYSFWPVIERATGELIGEAGLKPFEGGGSEAEIGYAFGPPWWGRGYATEAGRAIVDAALGPLGLHRLVGVTDDRNVGSQRVFDRLGFAFEGHRQVYGRAMRFYVLDRR